MLNAIRAPLVLGNFAEHSRTLVEQLINYAVLGGFLQVLECMLKKEGWSDTQEKKGDDHADLDDE